MGEAGLLCIERRLQECSSDKVRLIIGSAPDDIAALVNRLLHRYLAEQFRDNFMLVRSGGDSDIGAVAFYDKLESTFADKTDLLGVIMIVNEPRHGRRSSYERSLARYWPGSSTWDPINIEGLITEFELVEPVCQGALLAELNTVIGCGQLMLDRMPGAVPFSRIGSPQATTQRVRAKGHWQEQRALYGLGVCRADPEAVIRKLAEAGEGKANHISEHQRPGFAGPRAGSSAQWR